mgnify:CR=1 FL=1
MTTETASKPRPVVNVTLPKNKTIDIIIPFHGCHENVSALIENVFRFASNNFDKIILIDDFSSNDQFVNIYKENTRFVISRNDRHLGFGASVNRGISLSDKQVVAVLHSDVLFTDKNSLINLYNDLIQMRNESVAMITAVSNNPMIHENILKKNKVIDMPPEIVKENFIPMYCCMLDVAAWRIVNGVPEFPVAWFEDEAFCHKLLKLGYKIAASNKSYVFHTGAQTIKQILNKDRKYISIMKNNVLLLNKIRSK